VPRAVIEKPGVSTQREASPRAARPSAPSGQTRAPTTAKTGWFGLLVAGLVAALISYGLFSYLKGAVGGSERAPALLPADR
jgi:hypothetical protein